MTNIIKLGLLLSCVFIISCQNENVSNPIETQLVQKKNISGFVQKGPFINGSSISINELKNDLSQTGKTFNTQILDNKGSFEINNIELISNYISLRADGFYFNEILGERSNSQITLYALSDISDKTTINVNILSHLEKARVEYLILQGIEFQEAKKQAQTDILKIFKLSPISIEPSELLNISKDGEGNAILLAISLILQGNRSEGELSELLSNISADIKTDGILNSTTLGTQLINQAMYLDTSAIRNNLENRYADLGVDVQIPQFEKCIRLFIDSSDFEFTNNISFPIEGSWGKNILNTTDSIFISGNSYSMTANLPSGTTLKVKHNGNFTAALGFPMGQDNTGWVDMGPDESMVWRTFKTNQTGKVDMKLFFYNDVTLYIYENDTKNPTRIKNLYKSQ